MSSLPEPILNRSKSLSRVILLVWALVVSVPITFLTALHALPLPTRPVANSAAPEASTNGHWQAVHLLVADCPCSAAVAAYLIKRGAQRDLTEQVWIVGGTATWAADLVKAGFSVEPHDAEQVAAQLGIQGGPWLRLISPAGALVYSGGYAAQRPRQSEDFNDLTLWQAAVHGQTVPPYPAFGCAASRWLRQTTDPFGNKYSAAQ